MAYLISTKADLTPHTYSEIIDEITRNTDSIVNMAISSALGEAKGYLSRYDLPKIFGTSTADPTVPADQLETLKGFLRDIAMWKVAKLSNPNINMELLKTGYEEAIAWLHKIQKGQVDPEGWPYKEDDISTPGNENYGIQWSSNTKRTQHF